MSDHRQSAAWQASLDECLAGFPQARVAVFGDFCLDAYWFIDPDEAERSVETRLPVRRVRRQHYGLGGAGNVVANLADLGVGQVRAIGLVGRDVFGGEMLRLAALAGRSVDTAGLLASQDDWQTVVYAKPYRGDVEDHRLDFGAFNVLAPQTADALMARLDLAAGECDAVILNQQIPGGVSGPEVIEQINRIISRHPRTCFVVDSRDRAGLYRGAVLKLNSHEAALLAAINAECGMRNAELTDDKHIAPVSSVPSSEFQIPIPIPVEEVRGFAERLYAMTGRPVFITCGASGMIVADERGIHEAPAVSVAGPTDPVGAGDTVVAALAAVLAGGGDPLTAARVANIAASITVRKLHTTGTATPAEIRGAGRCCKSQESGQ